MPTKSTAVQKSNSEGLPHSETGELFRILAETSPNLIYIEQDGKLVYVNPAGCEVSGYSKDELLSPDFDFGCLIAPECAEEVMGYYREHKSGRDVPPYEFRLLTKDGGSREVLNATSLVFHQESPAILGVITDISLQKRAEEQIRAERDRAQHYLDIADVILVALDSEGRISMINRKGCELLGRSEDELLGRDWFSTALPEDWVPKVREIFLSLMGGSEESLRVGMNPIRSASGEERLVAWRNALVRDVAGNVTGTLSSGEDITEWRRAEEALRTVEAKFRALFERSPHPSALFNPQGEILACNEAVVALLGASGGPEGLVGSPVTDFVVQAQVPRLMKELQDTSARGVDEKPWKYTLVREDGGEVQVEAYTTAVYDQDGEPIFLVAQILDVSARERTEAALRETTERLRAFSSRLQDVREEERTAIARELHDELGQAMTGLRMDMAMCAERLPADRPDLQVRLREMIQLTDENIALVQNLSSQLRPPVLDVLGLCPAVEWLVEEIGRRSDLEFELDLKAEGVDMDQKTSIAAFRVVQEALTNVVRHAQAELVTIRLFSVGDHLVADVADDGIGILADAVDHPRSVGLLGMSERAIAQGGSLEIQGEPGAGTRVILTLPLMGVPQTQEPVR